MEWKSSAKFQGIYSCALWHSAECHSAKRHFLQCRGTNNQVYEEKFENDFLRKIILIKFIALKFIFKLFNILPKGHYEKHLLVGLNQVYYWVLKCTTCYHYTNIIKSGLINLSKIGNIFTTKKGLAYF